VRLHVRVDPFTSLAVLAAQVGVRRLVTAIGGAEDIAGLAGAMLGVLTQVEQSHTRLLAIEQKLDNLLDQRYTAGLGAGTRLLEQAFIEGRQETSRRDDLRRADAHLVDASHSANTAIQRALVERLLLLVRLGLGDVAVARDSWRRFDLHVGDAIAGEFARYEDPYAEAKSRIEAGEFGAISTWDRLFATPDPRHFRAVKKVESDACAGTKDLAPLLGDAMTGALLVGATEGRPPAVPVAGTNCVVVDVPLGAQVRLAGLVATMECGPEEPVVTGWVKRRASARVALSPDRSTPVRIGIANGKPDLYLQRADRSPSNVTTLAPGQELNPSSEVSFQKEHFVRRIALEAGGVVLSARVPSFGDLLGPLNPRLSR